MTLRQSTAPARPISGAEMARTLPGPDRGRSRLSLLRRLHPLTRLLLFVSLTANVFLLDRYATLLPLAGCVVLLTLFERVRFGVFKWLLAVMASALPLMVLVFWIAGCEETGNWQQGLAWGAYHAGVFWLRIKITVLFNIVLVRTTTVREFSDAFRALRVPEPAVLFLSTVVRFIPVSVAECRRIVEVQRCRGLRKSALLTPKGLLPIVIPLLLAHVRRAHDMALCLEIRHFSWRGQNSRVGQCLSGMDVAGWACAIALFALPHA